MEQVRFDAALHSSTAGERALRLQNYPNQIDDKTLRDRFSRLTALQNEHSLASNQSVEGELQ